MWWHVDLQAVQPGPGEKEALPDIAQGEFRLDWILPSLASEIEPREELPPSETAGGERRGLRRGLRESG